MSHFLANYSLFLAKALTLVFAILILVAGIISLSMRGKGKKREKIGVKKLNDKYAEMRDILQQEISTKHDFKKYLKSQKKSAKDLQKKNAAIKNIFLLKFEGDIRASAVEALREEITAILSVATPKDEIVLSLDSSGGMVPHYGLAASQLDRIKQKGIPFTIFIDKVAASGGYLMACVAQRIVAAPFAIIGSIGVIAQLPNFNRLLKKNNIDFEQITAGEFKRTITMFGENTDKGRKKLQEEVEETHILFKDFINMHRPQVEVNSIATGEYWAALKALDLKLIDEIGTVDDYLLHSSETCNIYQVTYCLKKGISEKIGNLLQSSLAQLSRTFI